VANYPDVNYFDVRDEDGRIVLVPLRAESGGRSAYQTGATGHH